MGNHGSCVRKEQLPYLGTLGSDVANTVGYEAFQNRELRAQFTHPSPSTV
jgi:hypothetical protein